MNKDQMIINIEAALYQHNIDVAEELAKNALADYPEERFGYEYMLKVLEEKEVKPFDIMEACYIKLIQLNPENLNYKIGLAKMKEEQAAYNDAMGIYANVLKANPQNADALVGLGRFFMIQEADAEKALSFFENAVYNAPNHAEAQYSLAVAYKKLGYLKQALNALSQISEEKKTEAALVLEIEIYELANAYAQTFPLYQKLLEQHPESLSYHYNYAKALDLAGEYLQALELYEKSVRLAETTNNAMVALYRNAAQTALNTKEYAKANTWIQKAIELKGANANDYAVQLEAFNGLGKFEDVLQLADQLLTTQDLPKPEQTPLLEQKGLALIALEKWEEAANIFLEFTQKSMTKAIGLYGLSFIEERVKANKGQALSFLKQAAEMGHQAAKQRIQSDFSNFSKNERARLLDAFDLVEAEELKDLLNKYWLFAELKTEATKNADEKLKAQLSAPFENQFLFLTEKGGFMLKPNGQQETFVYQVAQKLENGIIIIQIHYLDGSAPEQVAIGLRNHQLYYAPEPSRAIIFEAVTYLGDEIKTKVDLAQIDFLGEAIAKQFTVAK